MRLMSFACSRWKETDLELVAGNNRTGIETSPKVRLAVDMERAGMTYNLPRSLSANLGAIAFSGGAWLSAFPRTHLTRTCLLIFRGERNPVGALAISILPYREKPDESSENRRNI